MREIKFRAWDKERNEMFSVGEIYISLKGTIHLDMLKYRADDRFILMQFTGLLDKNGKEIYEGDICLAALPEEQFKVTAIYEMPIASFLFQWPDDTYESGMDEMTIDCFTDIEVIGNIHENPELLEKQ